MKRAMLTGLAVSMLAMTAWAQSPIKPDFAGTWVFDPEATARSAMAAGMQAGAIFGDTFVAEQSDTTLTLKINAGTLRVVAVYALDGSPSRNMSPPSIQNAQPIEVTSHAKWDAGKLIITSNSQSPSANGPVVVDSIRTMWLDEKGRLVIERVGTPRGMVPPSRSVYKSGQQLCDRGLFRSRLSSSSLTRRLRQAQAREAGPPGPALASPFFMPSCSSR